VAGTVNCAEFEELMALAALDVLPAGDGAALEEHLSHCAACRRTARAFQRTAAALPESLDLLQPPAALRRKLLTAVYAGHPEMRKRRSVIWKLWRRVPQARGFTLVAAGAAAAAAALAVWGASRPNPPATAQAQTFAVNPTTADPGATGELVYDPSTRASVLTVSGLPPTGGTPGASPRVFEVWLIPAGGRPVPAALLSRAPEQTAWTAVLASDALRYRSIAATIEPAGGTLAPTGLEVFSVSLTR